MFVGEAAQQLIEEGAAVERGAGIAQQQGESDEPEAESQAIGLEGQQGPLLMKEQQIGQVGKDQRGVGRRQGGEQQGKALRIQLQQQPLQGRAFAGQTAQQGQQVGGIGAQQGEQIVGGGEGFGGDAVGHQPQTQEGGQAIEAGFGRGQQPLAGGGVVAGGGQGLEQGLAQGPLQGERRLPLQLLQREGAQRQIEPIEPQQLLLGAELVAHGGHHVRQPPAQARLELAAQRLGAGLISAVHLKPQPPQVMGGGGHGGGAGGAVGSQVRNSRRSWPPRSHRVPSRWGRLTDLHTWPMQTPGPPPAWAARSRWGCRR